MQNSYWKSVENLALVGWRVYLEFLKGIFSSSKDFCISKKYALVIRILDAYRSWKQVIMQVQNISDIILEDWLMYPFFI